MASFTVQMERARKGLCPQCGNHPHSGDGEMCDQCLAEHRKQRKKARLIRFERRRSAGKCPQCGQPLAPGRSLCRTCLDYRNEQVKKEYRRRRAAGLCVAAGCSVKPLKGVLCDTHRFQRNKRNRDNRVERLGNHS